MQHEEEYEEEEEEIDLESIEDEQILIDMNNINNLRSEGNFALDEAEDVDERKRIRDRLKKVQYVIRAQREQDRKRREDEREAKLRNRVKDADARKKQTLDMYGEMAKKGGPPSSRQHACADSPISGAGQRRDLVEETIRDRLRAAEDRKKRIMAAYDHAAKSQPAGQARIVEFDTFSSADVSKLETKAPLKGSCTFGTSGGVPIVSKAPVCAPSKRAPDDDSHLDPMERAIRARVREADERKRRTLAAYDMVARSGGAGPKTVVLEEFKNMDISSQPKQGPRYDPCFRGGLKA